MVATREARPTNKIAACKGCGVVPFDCPFTDCIDAVNTQRPNLKPYSRATKRELVNVLVRAGYTLDQVEQKTGWSRSYIDRLYRAH